jgi:hypothetical protein
MELIGSEILMRIEYYGKVLLNNQLALVETEKHLLIVGISQTELGSVFTDDFSFISLYSSTIFLLRVIMTNFKPR